jgi:hypothetical protein
LINKNYYYTHYCILKLPLLGTSLAICVGLKSLRISTRKGVYQRSGEGNDVAKGMSQ